MMRSSSSRSGSAGGAGRRDFVRRRLWGLLVCSLLLLAGCGGPSPAGYNSPITGNHDLVAVAGDKGKPRIHQQHIFFGDINLQGEAVGFHYRATGEQAHCARIIPGTETRSDAHGVYQARVELLDPKSREWIPKHAMSSFYPDNWTPERVLSEIRSAYQHRENPDTPSDHFEGVSDSGVRIFGYVATDSSIVSAYPLRSRR